MSKFAGETSSGPLTEAMQHDPPKIVQQNHKNEYLLRNRFLGKIFSYLAL